MLTCRPPTDAPLMHRDLRSISYDGMIEKSELAVALAEARSLGKADPTIIDQFNRWMNAPL